MQSIYLKTFEFFETIKPSHLGLYFSLLLHLLILLFAIGLPDFFKPKKIFVPNVIPIEILNVSDVTSLKNKDNEIKTNDQKNNKVEQKKFNSSENTEIQKNKIDTKPKIKKNNIEILESEKKINQKNFDNNFDIKKPESKKTKIKEIDINKNIEEKKVPIDKIETLKEDKIKPKLKPKKTQSTDIKSESDLQLEKQVKPIEKPDIKKEQITKPVPIEKPEPDFSLATMLKDLRNEDISSSFDKNEEDKNKNIKNDKNLESNSEVSISEMDVVLQQLRSCFNPRAGTQIIGDEMVKISAKIDRQANVKKDTVQIVATNISKSNPYYEAITESAVATLYNPLCSRLKLPLNKYESWKDLKITIDYSWIKN